MFWLTIIIVLTVYIFYITKTFNEMIKELTKQNKSLEANLLKTKNKCYENNQKILEYKRKLGIKDRSSLFDCLTTK